MECDAVLDTGSETDPSEVLECDTCKLDSIIRTAQAFCSTCLEYMCNECSKQHCRPRQMRNHKVLKRDEMPIRRISQELIDTNCMCGNMENEVTVYCLSHQTLLCVTCIADSHSTCDFTAISDESKGVTRSVQYSKYLKELQDLLHTYKVEKEKALHHQQKCDKSIEQVCGELNSLRQLLKKKLEQVDELEQEAMELKEEYSRNMHTIETENGSSVGRLHENIYGLKTLGNISHDEKLFIALNRSRNFTDVLKKKMITVNNGNSLKTYRFSPCELLKNVLTCVDETGTILEVEALGAPQNVGKRTVREYPEYGLPKCVAVSESCVAVIERIHNTFEKIENGRTVAQIKLSSCPWDIAKLSSTSVAVTKPGEKRVSIIDMNDNLVETEINVHCRGEGITYSENKLYIASSNPPSIVIYDIKTTLEVRRIAEDGNGRVLFEQPAYIDVHPKSHLLCVSDRKSNKVCILKDTGEFVQEFACDNMKIPLAVAFQNNSVFAVGFESNTLNRIYYHLTNDNAVETTSLNDLAINEVFDEPRFEMNASWKYCAGKYFTIVCKQSL